MAKSKISAGFVKQVGWIGLQTGKSFVSDYTSNITQFLEDGKSMFNDMKQGKTKVVDAVNDIKANGGKKIADWFFDRSQETDGFGDWTNNSDSDFDAGYQVGDDGGDDTDQTPSKVLDEDSMKNIAGGQINAMYQIGAKQAEASMINAASITTSVDRGVANIVTAINNVNSSIATIGEKLDMITKVIVSQHDQEEAETSSSGNNGMFDSSGRVTLGSWWNNIKNQAKSGMDTVNTFLPYIMGSPSELLKEIIDFTGFRDKNLGTGIRNIANKFNIDEHEDRFINRLAEKLKGQTINTVGNDFNEWFGNGIHNMLGGHTMPKFLNNALDSAGFVGSFVKDIIASSAGIRRNKTLQDGSSAVSEYNRDTAKFDNMVRTSIVEVIPDYLKIIAKGVTGKEYNVSTSGHVTAQTKEERQREINNLMDYSANNGGVFSYELSKKISNKFSAHGVRGKGYDLSGMKKGSGKGSINEAFEEFDMDAARDQFGILAAFYFGDKLQHVAAFNNQLNDAFWDWLKEQLPAQLSTATGKDYEGKLKWMCLYYVDTVKNALEGSRSGVFNMNKEITSFLSNINSKADSIISSNNAAAKIAESFGRGDEYKAVTAKSFAERYHNDEKTRNTEKEIEKIKEDLYKKVRDQILNDKSITEEEFESWRYSGSKTKEGLKYRNIKRKVDEEYQKRLLTEKASIKQKQGGPEVIAFDEMTISKLEKAFEKSQEDASQVRTKEFDLNEDALFPKFAKDVVGLLTEIRDNTSGNPKPSNPSIILGNGDIPPLYNIWGHGDSAVDQMEDDKMADALNMGAQAKLTDDGKFDNNDTALIQQQGSKMHNKKLGNSISQFWRKFGFSNKQADDRKEASGENSSNGGVLSFFKTGLVGLVTKGASTILKGVGKAIINIIAKPILKFMLKGFKSGFNDITSGVKTLFGLGGESDEEAKKNALTVTIPEKIEKIFGFLTNKQQKEDAREAAKVEKEKKKEEEKKAKEQKKQEAEERKVKKQYDKMQGMTEEQRTRLQQQWEHAANNENASEATRKKAQEKLALINAANKFDNDAYEQRQAQQKYERTRNRLQAYRDDETKSEEFRNRARTRLRQVNAENYGSNFQNTLQSRQAYQEKRLAEFGEKINKVIPGFTKFANKMAAAGKKIWSGASSVVKGLGKAVLHPLKSFGKAITTVRDTVKKGFNGLVENIKQGGLNILEAGKAIKRQAAENGGGIKGWSKTLTAAAGVGIGKVTSFLSGHKNETEDEKIARKEKSRAALGKVGNVLGGTGKILLGISKMVMTAVMSMAAIKTLIASIKNVFNKSMKKLEPAVTKIVKIIQPLVSKIGDTVSKLAEGLSKMVTSMQGVFKVLVNSIGKVLDSLMTALEPVMEAVIRFATPLQSLIEGLMPVVEVLLDVGGSLLTQFIDMTTGFVTSLLPLVDTVICPAIQTIAGVIQVIAGGIQSLIGVVESGLGHVVEAIGNLAEFFTKNDSLAETGRSLQKAGLEAMEGGVEQVERGKQTIKDAWSGGSKVNEPTTDDTDGSSSTTYESKLPTLNASTGASVDTYASGDESTATSNGVEFGGTSVYGELGGMLESIGVLLNNIAVPLNEDIVPLIKNQWTIYQEPLLTAINNTYKNLLKPQYELVGKIAGKQVEIADDILTPTMVTQEVDIKNDLEESVAQQKMTQGIIQNIGGNLLAANGLLLAAAGQTAAGNMVYQTAAGLSAQGMTTTTSGIQQYVNNNSQLLTGKYFNLSQLYPDDPYEGYSTTATTKESATTDTPTEEVTTQPTTQSIPQVQSSSGQYREFYERGGYASGDSQGSFGSYLNMSQRGCGPVALADAANRRGGHINAGTLAGSMASSGRYSSSRGTSVGGFLDTAASLGMGYQAGGVTAGSLKRASANNPITLVGSGAGFGTRSGNTHFINVVGTDNSGGAYVSNPLSGRVERRSANDLVSGSVLGLYGSGDITMTPGGLYDLYGAGDTFSLTSAKNILESASTATLNGQNVGNYLAALYRNWNKYYEYTHPDIEVYYNSSLTKDQLTSNSSVANWFKNYLNNYSGLSYWSTSKTVYQKIIDDAAEYAQLVTTYKKISEAEAARKASTNSSSTSATSSETSTTTSSTTVLNRNKNTTASGTITSAEAAKWLSKIRGSAAGSTGLSDAIDRTYKEYNQKESTHNKTGADTYNLNMWWWKNALVFWDSAYETYNKSLNGNSTHLTFATWYSGLGKDVLNSEKGQNWQRFANGLVSGNDTIAADIDTIEAEESSESSLSSGITSAATTSAWSLTTDPGGFTGYISTEAKYTPGSTSTEAPTTGSSFTDRFKQAMSGLTNIWNNIMGIFSLSDKSDTEQAIEDAEEDKKEKKIRAEIGNEEYEQYEDLAWQAYMEANPQAQGESDATYQTRLKNGWTDKVKQKWMNKLAGEQANMIDAQRYNSISDVQEGVGSTIYGGYNQETGLWEGGAWSTMGTSGTTNSNTSSYNTAYTGTTQDVISTGQSQVTNTGNEDWTDTESNKKTIWAYLTNTLGFSKEGAAGAMGNMYAESNYSPYALLNHTLDDYSIEYANKVNSTGKFPSSDPYGIVQWLGSRRDKLLTHAKSSNASIADLSMQLAFLSNELNSDYKDVNSNMKGANDVQTASDYWQRHFEVCGEATNKRRNAAKEAYEQFKNATNLDVSSYETSTVNTSDLNNTLWINTLNRVIHETDVEGLHDYSQSAHPITLDGKTLQGRPDCTGMFKYAIDYLGYDTGNIQSSALVSSASSSNHPISKDGQPSEDFTAYSYSEVGKEGIRPGDILVEPGHGEVGYGLVGSNLKGWNFGSTTGIKQTQEAAARMLNGETVQSVMEGDNIQNMSTPTYVIRPSGQLTVPVTGSASTGGSGIAGGVGMNIGKFDTALNSTAGRYGQTGSYRNSYSKTSSFGNYASGAMGGYANFVSPEMVSVSSYSGNSGATSTMISGIGTLPAGKGINITGVTATAPAKSSAVAGMSSSGLATQMNVPASQKDRIRKRSGKPTKVTWHTWADNGGSTDPQILTDWWDSRECSVNYGISDNGVIKQEIDEGYGTWTSSSRSNDSQAVTLEIANSSGARSMGEEWPISDAAMQSAINLTYDIAKRNGISQFNFTRKAAKPYKNEDGADGNWTYHRMFANKSCPGDYIYDRTNDILNVINGALANTSATAQNSSLVNSITAAGDIPDINMSKVSAVTGVGNGSSTWSDYDNGILNGELLDETKANTTNIIVNRVESDQNTMMDRILEHTFNVRAVQVEELLETIIEKMDHMATTKNEQPVAAAVTQTQSSLFPSDDIPKQVQRLAQG